MSYGPAAMVRRLSLGNLVVVVLLLLASTTTTAFTSIGTFPRSPVRRSSSPPSTTSLLWSSLPDVSSMRIGELKKELESYGISTKSFLEKSELVGALQTAREEGKTPVQTTAGASSSKTSSSKKETTSREELIAQEMQTCGTMKVGELKKELTALGIATKTFFEKSEFVRALAEARVDGVGKGGTDEEGYAEYTNVEVLGADHPGPRKKQSPEEQQQQQGGGGNPFGGGGGGNPFGGGGGGNPFGGGGGGNPFGGGGNPFGGGGRSPFG